MRTTSAIVLLLAVVATADDEMDALWKDACQWEVGSAIPSMRAARDKLVAKGPAALDYIIPAKLDTEDGLVIRAIDEVVTKVGGDAAARLLPCLESDHPNVRKVTASLLGKLGAKEASPRIAKLLGDPDARGGALEALGMLKAVEAVPSIAELVASAPLERTRVACIGTLAAIGGEEAETAILSALSAKGAAVRFAAQFALEKLKAVEALRARLTDEDARVRLHAIAALGHIGDAAAHDDLLGLIDSKSAVERGFAAEAIAATRKPEDAERLKAALAKETDPFAKGKLQAALGAR